MKKFTLLSVAAAIVVTAFAAASFAQEDGFVSIFNGKDLTGWAGDPNLWSVEDGCIVGQTNDSDKKITVNQALYYKDDMEIGDFAISFDYKISNWGNSGLYYRGWFLETPEKFRVGGYQGDFDGSATYSGIMYGEAFRGILANLGTVSRVSPEGKIEVIQRFATEEEIRSNVKIEDWNHYEIVAKGYVFVHKINGKVTSVFVDEDKDDVRRKSGLIGWQLHVGDGGMRVQVKNIYLKKF
ncbi:MAG: DUF1080 domain-containing protein [Thermoguttaceae bacterium]|nr:DUF1080 domain-containing protein [Thermoguttaceae bacterium]MBQ3821508.1 DUF1080 domain-containing protein [Thermoguttaceae bacterium]MBR6387294.1 DUF1080 domain-containing protein [Thermoguttaceae bacterium]